MEGFIPVVHTIAPFLIERSLEQLKDDFCYQKLGGNFVSVGASYDYAALGCTHHCPGDVGILKNLPDMEIVLPGTSDEFEMLFNTSYNNSHPTYFRLSEKENITSHPVEFGKAVVVKKGELATVIAVGTTLDVVLEATKNMNVTVLYYTTVSPFDSMTLKQNLVADKILLCEPYYKGGLVSDIMAALVGRRIALDCVGVPLQFLNKYGNASQHDKFVGLTVDGIQKKLKDLISE